MDMQRKLWLGLIGLFLVAVGLRVVAPSDLYDNDQPKTVAYTVDMVRHDHWALPVDMLGRAATKPPMFNWISAPFVAIFGVSEITLKIPAILAMIVTMGWIVIAGWELVKPPAAILAAYLLLASTVGMKLIYLARPDGVLAAFMIGAWWCGTVGLKGAKGSFPWAALGFWLCVAGAALSKGPVAVIPLIYVLLAARLIHGQWRAALRLRWSWGLPLLILIVGGWMAAAYVSNPSGFTHGLIGDMMRAKGHHGLLVGVLNNMWKMPAQFIARFAPWSLFVIFWLVQVSPRRWFKYELAPAVLWVLLVVGFFALLPRHRPDYLAPAFGPAALIAAAWLMETGYEFGLSLRRILLACAAIVLGLGAYGLYFNHAAQTQFGQHVRNFVTAVQHTVGEQRVTCIDTGYNPLQPLLGINDPPGSHLPRITWVIRPVHKGEHPLLQSQPLSEVHDTRPGVVGLFRLHPPRP